MKSLPNLDDVVWTQVNHLDGTQWIRAVVEFVYIRDRIVVVHALFPGDCLQKVWNARVDDLREEQPPFDEVDSTYEGGDMEFA